MWNKQKDAYGWTHWIEIDQDHTFQVYKTAGGDYAMVCYHEGDPCGGEPEYFDLLKDAKATAERILASGNWKYYTLDETSPLI